MIKKLIENHKRKKIKRIIEQPRFCIKDLYVGDIVLKQKEVDDGPVEVKKSVIVVNVDNVTCKHIKSNQVLAELYWADVGDYALTNMEYFKSKFVLFMRKNHLTSESKLSIKQILQLEDALQTGLYDDLKFDDLFK